MLISLRDDATGSVVVSWRAEVQRLGLFEWGRLRAHCLWSLTVADKLASLVKPPRDLRARTTCYCPNRSASPRRGIPEIKGHVWRVGPEQADRMGGVRSSQAEWQGRAGTGTVNGHFPR